MFVLKPLTGVTKSGVVVDHKREFIYETIAGETRMIGSVPRNETSPVVLMVNDLSDYDKDEVMKAVCAKIGGHDRGFNELPEIPEDFDDDELDF